MDEYEEAVLFTYSLMESRLDRIGYVLGGTKGQHQEKPRNLSERIQRLEKSLKELSNKTVLLQDAQELVSKHSDIVSKAKIPDADADKQEDAGLNPAQKAAMVVERAPGFATTASQLKALDDQQVPQTDGFVELAKLRPRIAEAENRHLQQALQISLLRKRSGMLVSRAKQVHLVGQGRCSVEWHKRLQDTERTIVRAEFKLRKEGGPERTAARTNFKPKEVEESEESEESEDDED